MPKRPKLKRRKNKLAPPAENPNPQQPQLRLMSKQEVCARTGRSYGTLWRWMQLGHFPRARRIKPSPNERVGWYAHEFEAWLANLPIQPIKGDKGR